MGHAWKQKAPPFHLFPSALPLLFPVLSKTGAPWKPINWICTPPQLKLKASVARRNAGRNAAGEVLKHTHQSQLLCAELYNMLDWPLKSINLNQHFSPICHPSFSLSLPRYLFLLVHSFFFCYLSLIHNSFVSLYWNFPLSSLTH